MAEDTKAVYASIMTVSKVNSQIFVLNSSNVSPACLTPIISSSYDYFLCV